MTTQLEHRRGRPTLWVLYDLERVAWVVEQRATELTPGDRQLLHAVAARLERVAGEYER